MTVPGTVLLYVAAALVEIAGSFAVWTWMRHGTGVVWLAPGLPGLTAFA